MSKFSKSLYLVGLLMFFCFVSANCAMVLAQDDSGPVSMATITMDPSELTVDQARMASLQLFYKPAEESELSLVPAELVNWKSANSSIATVFRGQVTGVRVGKTTITAEYEGMTAVADITVVKPAQIEKTGPVHSFFELVSNIGLFNHLLESYDLGELKVCLPEKVIKQVDISTTEFATDFALTTSSEVRKVTVRSRGQSYDARMESPGQWQRGIAGLKVGDEVTIKAYTSSSKQLEQLIFRLKKGNMQFIEDNGGLNQNVFTLRELSTNQVLFNQVLKIYSMSELSVVAPLRYLGKIEVDPTPWATFFKVYTLSPAERVVIKAGTTEYQAIDQGEGLWTRDITGLSEGELVTVEAIDENGDIAESKIVEVKATTSGLKNQAVQLLNALGVIY